MKAAPTLQLEDIEKDWFLDIIELAFREENKLMIQWVEQVISWGEEK